MSYRGVSGGVVLAHGGRLEQRVPWLKCFRSRTVLVFAEVTFILGFDVSRAIYTNDYYLP